MEKKVARKHITLHNEMKGQQKLFLVVLKIAESEHKAE